VKTELVRSGLLVRLNPWIPAVEALLQYDYVAFGGKNGKNVVEKRALYYLTPEDNCGYFPAGLLERVQAWLTEAGHEYTYKDDRDLTRLFPEPQWGALEELRDGQREALEAIATHDHGLVVCSTGFGKSFMIQQLCKIYPDSRFVIAAPGIAEVRNLSQGLLTRFPADQVGVVGDGMSITNRRITVTTTASLKKTALEDCDFFLFDEAHTVGSNKTSADLMSRLTNSRNYGFTATPTGRSDKSDNVLRAVFGDEIVNYTYNDCQEAGGVTPIEVFIYDIIGDIPSTSSRFGNAFITNKRRFYWRNEYRNLCIAHLMQKIPQDQQVLIMVETVDHLITLGELLPDFALVCGSNNDLQVRAKKRHITLNNTRIGGAADVNKEIYKDFREGRINRVISNFVWKQAVDIQGLNVLVRADGSPSGILSVQIPGRLSRLAPGKDRAVLIDFRDMFNKTATGNYYNRLRHYKRQGWTINHRGDPLNERFADHQSIPGRTIEVSD